MSTIIRVAMIIQGYHPRVGGAERQLKALAPLLQQRDVELHVLTRRYPGLPAFEIIEDVPVHRLPVPGPKPIAALSFTLAALPLLRRLQPDMLHAHEVFSPATTALAAKRLLRVPVIVTAHRSGPLGDVERLKHKTLGMRRLAAFRQHVDRFITISSDIDAELATVGVPAARRTYVPNGVDTADFGPVSAAEQHALRQSLGLPAGLVAVFTGRLAPEKRVNQLVDIWPAVLALYPEASLVVVGDGPMLEQLRQSAGPGLHFVGNQEAVRPFLQAADLFVLPSVAEGLSVALLEAMSSGLPAISTAVGGAGDVIEHGVHGWLVPPDQPLALQAALVTVLGDAALRQRLGLQAREQVIHHFSLSAAADRLREVYDSVLQPLALAESER